MRYFKTTTGVKAIDADQVFLIKDDWIEINIKEVYALNKSKTDEDINNPKYKISEAKAYLASTDFYMTIDKYAELDEARKVELTTKRAEARKFIRANEI